MIKKTVRDIPLYLILPIILIAAIVPLIVYLKVVTLDSISYQFWTGDKENADFFSWYKAILTVILSVAALLAFAFAKYKGIIETKKLVIYYVPIAVYALLIILSTTYSKYPITAREGFVDRYEGVFVLLGYLLILFITINLVNSKKHIKIIIGALFVSAFILGMIGIFQYFGLDLFRSAIGKELIMPEEYRKLGLAFTFGAYTIYSTLYNTNYVGSYMAILFPLCLAAFVYFKKPSLKITMAVMTCLMFANWVGCRSRAGYMGGAVGILLLIILLRKSFIKNYKTVIPLFVSFVLIFVGMDIFAGGGVSKRLIATVKNINDYSGVQTSAGRQEALKDIVLGGNNVTIKCQPDSLTLALEGTGVVFRDTNGEVLNVVNDGAGNISIKDDRYEPFKVLFDSASNIFQITLNNKVINLIAQQDGFKMIGERNIIVDSIDHPQAFGFKGQERFASSRGYIWSRSIPLLKNNLIIGGGPDTYAIQFPQHDYVGKLLAFDTVNEIVDKPHNMYLQIGINTGVLSLLAVLFLFIAYVVSSIKLYFRKNDPDEINLIGIALFCAVFGYLVAGLANDSLVSVAPVFWVVLGLGISCNYMIIQAIKTPVAETVANIKAAIPVKKKAAVSKK